MLVGAGLVPLFWRVTQVEEGRSKASTKLDEVGRTVARHASTDAELTVKVDGLDKRMDRMDELPP